MQISSLRIAVAEDEPANRKLFVQLLQALGHEVPVAVEDGESLVAACQQQQIDLVFTDFHLPKMDGLAAAEFLAGKGIPVVIISGHPDAESIVIDHEPIEMVIRKPATMEKLKQAIELAMAAVRDRESGNQ